MLSIYPGSISILPQTFPVRPLKYITLYSVLYFSAGKVGRGEGENTGINKGKELVAVVVSLFP